jgi:predicted transposase YbfD/YdcC
MTRDSIKVDLSEVVCHFEQLEDPRSTINRRHPLTSVIAISLLAVLAGADGPTGIHKWAKIRSAMLLRTLDLPHGIPSRDVIRRVLCAIKVNEFQQCFVNWLNTLRDKAQENAGVGDNHRTLMAIDGKTMKGSYDTAKGLGAMHLVSVWLSEFGLTMAQVATDAKSNEITAIPELLKLVDLTGAIITIDAMGTQTAIAEQIVDGKADYVLALKGNQGKLHQQVIDYIDTHLENDFANVTVQRLEEEAKKGHGRIDSRMYLQFNVPDTFEGRSRWKNFRTIGVVLYKSLIKDKEHIEVRYFISSLRLNVKQFAKAVRNHWGIESTCHWSLDVTYREDGLRTRQRQIAENLAWLRRFTLSLLKQHPGKESLAMKRRMCGWSEEFLLEVIGAQGV